MKKRLLWHSSLSFRTTKYYNSSFQVDVASDVPDENIPSDATTEAQNSTYIGHIIPEDFLIKAGLLNDSTDDKEIKPLYNLNEDGTLQSTSNMIV